MGQHAIGFSVANAQLDSAGCGNSSGASFSNNNASQIQSDRNQGTSTNGGSGKQWAQVWFKKLCQFHRQPIAVDWAFQTDDVIAFLQSKRDAGCPAWKRRKIVEALIDHQRTHPTAKPAKLRPIRDKLAEIQSREEILSTATDEANQPAGANHSRRRQVEIGPDLEAGSVRESGDDANGAVAEPTSERPARFRFEDFQPCEAVGKLNAREPETLRAMRIRLRVLGKGRQYRDRLCQMGSPVFAVSQYQDARSMRFDRQS